MDSLRFVEVYTVYMMHHLLLIGPLVTVLVIELTYFLAVGVILKPDVVTAYLFFRHFIVPPDI